MKQKFIILSMALLLALVGLLIWNPAWIKENAGVASATEVTVYRSPTCGCCENYARYLERQGFAVDLIETNAMNRIKARYDVPRQLESCHTTIVSDYVVEGHIPVEVIDKLLTEKPAVAGIAMPGMPAGSPGMPGAKTGKFKIYTFDEAGRRWDVFMEM